MISIVEYNDTFKDVWNSFIDKSRNGIFMLNRNFMEYHKDRFTDSSLMFFDDEKLVAVLPLNKRENSLFSHQGLTFGGLIVSDDLKQTKTLQCFELLINYMKDHKFNRLVYKKIPSIYCNYPCDEDLYALFRFNARILKVEPSATINLAKPLKVTKGRKAQISRAKKNGVIIKDSNDFESFMSLENDVLQKHHNAVATHTAQEIELLHSRFPDNIKLIVAEHNSVIIAGALLFVYKNIVHTQYLAADDLAREIGALDLVIKTAIDTYKDSKQFFDFGTSTEDNGSVLNEGLIYQKESFGARVTAHQTFVLDI